MIQSFVCSHVLTHSVLFGLRIPLRTMSRMKRSHATGQNSRACHGIAHRPSSTRPTKAGDSLTKYRCESRTSRTRHPSAPQKPRRRFSFMSTVLPAAFGAAQCQRYAYRRTIAYTFLASSIVRMFAVWYCHPSSSLIRL